MSQLSKVACLVVSLFWWFALAAQAADALQLVKKDGRFALLADGQPYLILAAQINNSRPGHVLVKN